MSWKDDRHVELNLSAIFTDDLLYTTNNPFGRENEVFVCPLQQLYREIQGKVFWRFLVFHANSQLSGF